MDNEIKKKEQLLFSIQIFEIRNTIYVKIFKYGIFSKTERYNEKRRKEKSSK